ncbi:uncharacterized protein M421DRAFT_3136 [Didymella exigua CBS 183.55]|uniref:Uncharacterized protein n=1 Tax=Didymella exigua CBS 183.55 TaxID=1150837 RepID=A0A6A5RX38_9PLEO|nr:uncharacterized protein M421DRAFT_3136 [Didymella exigua CBS 183.55]KAF1930856.1 hypothetical protein M421DRAFT_3136 [Didymella exigua CBS 183.55]
MANSYSLGHAPDGHEHNQMASLNNQACLDSSGLQFRSPYQQYAQEGSRHMYERKDDPWCLVENNLGGTARAQEDGVEETCSCGNHEYGNQALVNDCQSGDSDQPPPSGKTMALGYQQADHLGNNFGPFQPRCTEATYDGTWDQSTPVGGSTWSYGRQQNGYAGSDQKSLFRWHPFIPQASESTKLLGLNEQMKMGYSCGDTETRPQVSGGPQYEQVVEAPARDNDMMSEASIDLEQDLAEIQTASRDNAPSVSYGYPGIFDTNQPWSPWTALGNASLYTDVDRFSGRIEVLKTEEMTDTSQDAASSYVMVDETSSASSFPVQTEGNMADSAATLRQQHPQPLNNEDLVVYTDLHGMAPMIAQQEASGAQIVLDLASLYPL